MYSHGKISPKICPLDLLSLAYSLRVQDGTLEGLATMPMLLGWVLPLLRMCSLIQDSTPSPGYHPGRMEQQKNHSFSLVPEPEYVNLIFITIITYLRQETSVERSFFSSQLWRLKSKMSHCTPLVQPLLSTYWQHGGQHGRSTGQRGKGHFPKQDAKARGRGQTCSIYDNPENYLNLSQGHIPRTLVTSH
jgi:hypothetical protein